MKKLDAYSPLGYSCAGEVIEVGEGVTEFEVGDKVACAGLAMPIMQKLFQSQSIYV